MNTSPVLLDVSVLIALLWPRHVHFEEAHSWFASARTRGWATCPITELGCARILGTPALAQGTLTVQSALVRLGEILAEPDHTFWTDDLSLSDPDFEALRPSFQAASQLTDRYLLSLASRHDAMLATLDRSITASLPAASPLRDHVELLMPDSKDTS